VQRTKEKVCIIGGGIAGLGCAWALAKRGFSNVDVFEQEPWVFSGASGKNAAIFRPIEEDVSLARLARRSRLLLSHLQEFAEIPLFCETGLLLLEHDWNRVERLEASTREAGFSVERIQRPSQRWPHLLPNLCKDTVGVFCPQAGVLDPHALGSALMLACRSRGVRFHSSIRVTPRYKRRKSGDFVSGVEGQREVDACQVIVAAGALSSRCVKPGQPALPLLPLQRHLALLASGKVPQPDDPVVWEQKPEFYFRRESADLLASPCDESVAGRGLPQAELGALGELAEKFRAVDEELCHARVRHYWACVRTKTFDGKPIAGRDRHVSGLYWLTGLGGFGMSGGLAVADKMAESLTTERFPRELSVERFLHVGAPRL
jgi:glycine/D-amino acid oxidase-like deaminating enzyme